MSNLLNLFLLFLGGIFCLCLALTVLEILLKLRFRYYFTIILIFIIWLIKDSFVVGAGLKVLFPLLIIKWVYDIYNEKN